MTGEIGHWLRDERVEGTIKVFGVRESLVGGWFKGELMGLFSRLKEEGLLKEFEQ